MQVDPVTCSPLWALAGGLIVFVSGAITGVLWGLTNLSRRYERNPYEVQALLLRWSLRHKR